MERDLRKNPNFVRKVAMAGALATAFGVGAPLTNHEAQGSAQAPRESAATEFSAARSISCSRTKDVWYPLAKGDVITLRTSGAVLPADVTVDGVRQYDDDPNTRTLVQLKTSNNANKVWRINADYAGSLLVAKCSTNYAYVDRLAGREARRLDARNNPTIRVNWNSVSK